MNTIVFFFLVLSAHASGDAIHGQWGNEIKIAGKTQTFVWAFQNGEANFSSTLISDLGPVFTDTMYFTYTLPDGTENPRKIDLVAKKRMITLNSPTMAKAFNQIKMCGLEDWQTKEVRDVSDLACDGAPPTSSGWKLYSSLLLTGEKLSFGGPDGNAPCGSSAEARCRSFDDRQNEYFRLGEF